MAWISLFLAGLCEIGWPVGLKLGWSDEGIKPDGCSFAAVAIVVSGRALMWAQRTIPMGTAYATGRASARSAPSWSNRGLCDAASTIRIVSIALIVAGMSG